VKTSTRHPASIPKCAFFALTFDFFSSILFCESRKEACGTPCVYGISR
jgi:hypothetical protein